MILVFSGRSREFGTTGRWKWIQTETDFPVRDQVQQQQQQQQKKTEAIFFFFFSLGQISVLNTNDEIN